MRIWKEPCQMASTLQTTTAQSLHGAVLEVCPRKELGDKKMEAYGYLALASAMTQQGVKAHQRKHYQRPVAVPTTRSISTCKPPGRLFLLQSIKGFAGIGSSACSTRGAHISCTPPWHFVPTAQNAWR